MSKPLTNAISASVLTLMGAASNAVADTPSEKLTGAKAACEALNATWDGKVRNSSTTQFTDKVSTCEPVKHKGEVTGYSTTYTFNAAGEPSPFGRFPFKVNVGAHCGEAMDKYHGVFETPFRDCKAVYNEKGWQTGIRATFIPSKLGL